MHKEALITIKNKYYPIKKRVKYFLTPKTIRGYSMIREIMLNGGC